MNGLLRDLAESLKIDAESLQHTISISKVKSAEANLVVLLTAFASLLLAKDLSRDDAEDMLEKLAAHYGEPVQPVSRYCASLRLWQRALHERAERALLALAPDLVDEKDSSRQFEIRSAIDKEVRKAETGRDQEGELPSGKRAQQLRELGIFRRQAYQVDSVFLDISKSNLLYRLLYCGEKLREEMCPEHKGEWNGQAMLDGCKHGCHGTGWLSSVPVDKSVTPIMIATVRDGVVLDISPPEGSLDAPVGSPDPPKT